MLVELQLSASARSSYPLKLRLVTRIMHYDFSTVRRMRSAQQSLELANRWSPMGTRGHDSSDFFLFQVKSLQHGGSGSRSSVVVYDNEYLSPPSEKGDEIRGVLRIR